MSAELSVAGYARAVERHWSELSERPVVLSPRDFRLVSAWHERGIPLELVREALDATRDRDNRRSTPGPIRLSYVAAAVEEAWGVIVEGRRSELAAAPASDLEPGAGRSIWEARRSVEPPGSALASLLDELLAAHGRDRPRDELDAELDRRLPDCVPAELLARIAGSVDRELGAFRARIPADELEATRSRAVVARLRDVLDLPRLPLRARTG